MGGLQHFIEGGKTGDEVVKFGGVGVTDKEVVYNEDEGSGVGVVVDTSAT